MTQSPYVMNDSQTHKIEYIPPTQDPTLSKNPITNTLYRSMQQITHDPDQHFQLMESEYESCFKADDSQHSSSLVLDHQLEFSEELQAYILRRNPELEKIFTRIKYVNLIVEKGFVRACRPLAKNNPLKVMGIQYEYADKELQQLFKQLFRQGCESLEQYDCEHNRVVLQAFNEVLKPVYHADFEFIYLNDPITITNLDGTTRIGVFAELLDQFVERTYWLTQEKEFKYQQKKRKDRARNQFESAKRCIDLILEKHSRVLVIRIDLRFDKTQNPTLDQVKKDLRTFLRSVGRTKNLNILGYIWKLEFGQRRGFHYHFIFILDSRDHSQEIKLAQQIGQIWEKVIGVEGTFHNCHFKAVNNQYDKLAIGRLHRHEQQKYQYLLGLLRYFAKKDQFILHKNIGKERTLGTSIDKNIAKTMGRKKQAEVNK
ncbi:MULTISPECIES: YagK/YfjJ domain-containing protein [Acinetobacter]|uniref:YagK/YfjJ domain-containing protein n=1 Tax=Acinetobacter TaxID=469 RepID=UPI000679ADF0|nr:MULTISPECIES: inovirus-type Gp2 protein [Acinetobacter]UTO18433.1 inovirus Gp2 family protein [Acinetobacter sp. Z1]